jgi:hypothetical protein
MAMALGLGIGLGAGRLAAWTRPHPAELPHAPLLALGPTCEEPSLVAEPGCPQPGQSVVEVADTLPIGPTCTTDSLNEVKVVDFLEPDGGTDFRVASHLFDFGVLQGHEPMAIGDETVINGSVMRMATLFVPLPAMEVIRRYNIQLHNNGVMAIYGQPLGPDGPLYLTFHQARSNVRRTITVLPHGQTSTVLLSVGDPSTMQEHVDSIPAALPHPAGAKSVIVDEIHDGASRQTDVAFQWPKNTVPSAKQYYVQELIKGGFRPEQSTWNADKTDSWHQAFERGGENLVVALDKQNDGVQVSMLWIHS